MCSLKADMEDRWVFLWRCYTFASLWNQRSHSWVWMPQREQLRPSGHVKATTTKKAHQQAHGGRCLTCTHTHRGKDPHLQSTIYFLNSYTGLGWAGCCRYLCQCKPEPHTLLYGIWAKNTFWLSERRSQAAAHERVWEGVKEVQFLMLSFNTR